MTHWKTLADIRREYGDLSLDDEHVPDDPMDLFKEWLEESVAVENRDPTAMVLSTVDKKGYPDSRVVLLKGVEHDSFIFYTNYESTKAVQLSNHPYAALNFYWPVLARQVRIRGRVKCTSKKQSDDYFSSRPKTSQISAMISMQSRAIASRVRLEEELNRLIATYGSEPILRPKHWGGYLVMAQEVEFWQGRDNRLHDRIVYCKEKGAWSHTRLAP